MSGASTVPVRGAGGRYGGGVSDEGGRHGDDDTSEEGGYDYKAAARQLWSGQGDDSDEDEVRVLFQSQGLSHAKKCGYRT